MTRVISDSNHQSMTLDSESLFKNLRNELRVNSHDSWLVHSLLSDPHFHWMSSSSRRCRDRLRSFSWMPNSGRVGPSCHARLPIASNTSRYTQYSLKGTPRLHLKVMTFLSMTRPRLNLTVSLIKNIEWIFPSSECNASLSSLARSLSLSLVLGAAFWAPFLQCRSWAIPRREREREGEQKAGSCVTHDGRKKRAD